MLRKVDFSETSRIVTFLTPHRGRMACMARGARRKGSPLSAGLDTFNRCELTYTWKDSRQVQTLVEAVVLNAHGRIKKDILRMAAAAFVLETALHAAQENNPAPALYNALAGGLARLDADMDASVAALTATAIYTLLDAAGHAPEDDVEGLALHTGAMGASQRKELRPTLVMLSHGELPPEDYDLRCLLRFLNDYAATQFERGFKSFAFLDMLMAGEAP